jgi:hypothetical protein
VQIKNEADAVASAQRHGGEDEPVWNAIRMDYINRAFAINAKQLARCHHREAAVLNDVGADSRPLISLDRLAVELGAIKFATNKIAVTLEGDDADMPAGGNGGTGGATDARILIDVGVHYECQVRHGSPHLLNISGRS